MIEIRNARPDDRDEILSFCESTFSWGDYIDQVWDLWLADSAGQMFVAESEGKKAGLAHVAECPGRTSIWLEGIRVHPSYRRAKIAMALIDRMIAYGRERGASRALAIVARENSASRTMMEKCEFKVISEWSYYSADRPLAGLASSARLASIDDLDDLLRYLEHSESYQRAAKKYVSTWRWYPLDPGTLTDLLNLEKVVVFGRPIAGMAVINKTGYWSRKNVMQIVYLDSDLPEAIRNLVSFAIDIFVRQGNERLQILFPSDRRISDVLQEFRLAESEQFLLYSKFFTG